jgi:hypothetical protein
MPALTLILILVIAMVPASARCQPLLDDAPIRSPIPVAPRTGAVAGTIVWGGGPVEYARVSIVGELLGGTTDEKGRYRIPNIPAGARRIAVNGVVRASVLVMPGETLEAQPVELSPTIAGTALDTLVLSPWWVRGEQMVRVVAGSRCPVHGTRLVERTVEIDGPLPRSSDHDGYQDRERQYPFVWNHLRVRSYSANSPRYARTLCCAACDGAQKASIAAARRRLGQPFQTIDVGRWDDPVPGAGRPVLGVTSGTTGRGP